ncbi:hypothetical protein ANMWB30_34280 [Arthrobacter sp. MWB30]|nr:hypothetical protein ANMWB30_34280 [Arthrobacter sp. MWB30]
MNFGMVGICIWSLVVAVNIGLSFVGGEDERGGSNQAFPPLISTAEIV